MTRVIGHGWRALMFLALLAPTHGGAEEGAPPSSRLEPLFPVTLAEPFSEPTAVFDQVRRLILEHYYSSTLSEAALYHAAIKGMLRHVSPPRDPDLAKLWSPAEYERILSVLTGERLTAGIRSAFNRSDGSLVVREVLSGSPADGLLQPNDRILRIGGKPLQGLDVDEVEGLLRGEEGTVVHLTVVRDIQVFEVDLILKLFESQDLVWEELPQGVGYVEIRKMSRGVAGEVGAAIGALRERGVGRVILDLRDNGGGVLVEGLRIAELFLPARAVMLRTQQSGDRIKNFVSTNAEPLATELAVLINGKTASASEVVAAALQAHRRARLVGVRTFGKASMEETFQLDNGYRVKFIIGALFEPAGRSWERNGLTPDVQVDLDDAERQRYSGRPAAERLAHDPQMRTAWLLLQ